MQKNYNKKQSAQIRREKTLAMLTFQLQANQGIIKQNEDRINREIAILKQRLGHN